jgi:WD40 repeat protein
MLATAGLDGTVRIWRAVDGQRLRTLTGHEADIYGVSFSPDGELLATASLDGIRVWDARSGAALRVIDGHVGAVYAIGFNAEGTLLASGGFDRTIRIWEPCPGCLDPEALLALARERVTRELTAEERATFLGETS